MQLNYDKNMEIGFAGLKADLGSLDSVLTYRAAENVRFGSGMFQGSVDRDGRLGYRNEAVLAFDADFVASNSVVLDVNGEEVGPVVFDTDHPTTLANLAAAIDAEDDVSAEVTGAREITITSSNGQLTVENVEVTLGASQAEGTVEYSSVDKFIGVALHAQGFEMDRDNFAEYKEKDAVSVLSRGRVYVRVEQDVNVFDSVYVRVFSDDEQEIRGHFRKDDDNGNAVLVERARFTKDAEAGGLAVLEVNLA